MLKEFYEDYNPQREWDEYLSKQAPTSEMENSLNEEVVSKIMTCNELNEEEKKELDEWLDSIMEKYNEPF